MEAKSFENRSESSPQVSEVMVANMLQLSLMPLAYKILYPEVEINMADPEMRNQIAETWKTHFAQTFREYIEDHPRETIDLGDKEALLEFLARFAPDATIH